GVDHADRHLRAGRQIRSAIVQHARARLRLHVEQRVRLQRFEEGREVEVAEGGGVHELQGGARDASGRIRDRRYRITTEQDLTGRRERVTDRVEARHDVVEELLLRAQVVAKAEAFERRAVDENDLRLDVHL